MKKLLFILLGTLTLQFSQAQAPNDNIGSGNCLDFDGINDLVSLPAEVSNIGTGDFSIEFWINSQPIPAGETENVIGNRNDACSGGGTFWTINMASTYIGLGTYVPGTWISVATGGIDDGQWHHLVFTRSATEMRAYQDGVLIQEVTAAPQDITNTSVCRIGVNDCSQFWPGGGRFSGQLDELRIWDVALTQAQVENNMCQPLVGNETGLVGYWNMNEGSSGTITDLTSNGYDGTLQ